MIILLFSMLKVANVNKLKSRKDEKKDRLRNYRMWEEEGGRLQLIGQNLIRSTFVVPEHNYNILNPNEYQHLTSLFCRKLTKDYLASQSYSRNSANSSQHPQGPPDALPLSISNYKQTIFTAGQQMGPKWRDHGSAQPQSFSSGGVAGAHGCQEGLWEMCSRQFSVCSTLGRFGRNCSICSFPPFPQFPQTTHSVSLGLCVFARRAHQCSW